MHLEREDCGCVSFFSSVSHGFGTTCTDMLVCHFLAVSPFLLEEGFAPIGVESSLFSETNLFAGDWLQTILVQKKEIIVHHSLQHIVCNGAMSVRVSPVLVCSMQNRQTDTPLVCMLDIVMHESLSVF